jgi:hypothetical protein
MIILLGLGFLVWAGVFAILWEWALNNVDGCWGGLLPIGWVVLVPCIVAQFCIWWG